VRTSSPRVSVSRPRGRRHAPGAADVRRAGSHKTWVAPCDAERVPAWRAKESLLVERAKPARPLVRLGSPVDRLQVGANVGTAVARAVSEVSRVPHDDVAILDDFAVDETVDVGA
jgi:hypothetical protein